MVAFRRHLAERGVRLDAGIAVLREAVAMVEDRAVAAPAKEPALSCQ